MAIRTATVQFKAASNGFAGATAAGLDQLISLDGLVEQFGSEISLADLLNILAQETADAGNVVALAEAARLFSGSIPEAIARLSK